MRSADVSLTHGTPRADPRQTLEVDSPVLKTRITLVCAVAVQAALIASPGITPASQPDHNPVIRTASGSLGSLAVALHRPAAVLDHAVTVQSRRIEIEQRRQARVDKITEQQKAFDALGVSQATLDSIASCESGGDPAVVSSDGSYRGKYQFDYGTWASVGGSGDPAAAPEAEQDYRAALLYSRSGTSPWPVCG